MAELNLTGFSFFLCACGLTKIANVSSWSEGSTSAQAENWHFAVPVFDPCHCTVQQGAELPLIIAVYVKVQINLQT